MLLTLESAEATVKSQEANAELEPLKECRFRIFHMNDVYTLENFPMSTG